MADTQIKNNGTDPTPTPETKTVEMTQADFDIKFNTSFGKGATKATNDILESLGVESIDDLKGIIKDKNDAEEANKTELQKTQDLLDVERGISADLESKLQTNLSDAEVQSIALNSGVSPDKIKYFKMDYTEAKKSEDFDPTKFIETLKESQPSFFIVDNGKAPSNVPNPPNRSNPSSQIKMKDYAQLPAAERRKYKSSDIIR